MDLFQIWSRHGGRCVLRIEMSRFEIGGERKGERRELGDLRPEDAPHMEKSMRGCLEQATR